MSEKLNPLEEENKELKAELKKVKRDFFELSSWHAVKIQEEKKSNEKIQECCLKVEKFLDESIDEEGVKGIDYHNLNTLLLELTVRNIYKPAVKA